MKTPILSAIAALAISAVGITWAARDGSGTYVLPAGNPVSTSTTISSTWANTTLADIATAITNSIAKDGQTVPTANLPMGGFRHTNVADAASRNQYATAGQAQDFALQKLGGVSGTNAIIGGLTPPITSYSAGALITLTPTNNNTGATTLAVNGLTALDVQKYDGDALVSGDLVAGIPAVLVLDAGGDDWILLNPQSANLINGVALSDLARLSQANGFTNTVTATSAGASFAVRRTGDTPYIEWQTTAGTSLGYVQLYDSTNLMEILNTQSGGNINLVTSGGGAVQANGNTVLTTASSLNASNLGSGTVPDARISSSSVTQHLTGGVAVQANTRNISVKASTTKVLVSNASCPPSVSGDDGRITYCY